MQTALVMTIFIGYSLLAPIITAGGSMLTTNALTLIHIDLIRATGITSAFFCINACISCIVFRKDIMWIDVQRMIVPVILGAFLGAYILVNIPAIILMVAMFIFTLHFIYKKVTHTKAQFEVVSRYKDWVVGFFSSAVIGAALPGGGFLNAYFASKGYKLTQMFGTLSLLAILTYVIKVTIMVRSEILSVDDLIPAVLSIPFFIGTNYLVRHGLLKLTKKTTDIITIFAMVVLAVYLLVSVIVLLK